MAAVAANEKRQCQGRICGSKIVEAGRAIRYAEEQCKRVCADPGSNLCKICSSKFDKFSKGIDVPLTWHGRYGEANLPPKSHIQGSEWNIETRKKEDARVAKAAKVLAKTEEAIVDASEVIARARAEGKTVAQMARAAELAEKKAETAAKKATAAEERATKLLQLEAEKAAKKEAAEAFKKLRAEQKAAEQAAVEERKKLRAETAAAKKAASEAASALRETLKAKTATNIAAAKTQKAAKTIETAVSGGGSAVAAMNNMGRLRAELEDCHRQLAALRRKTSRSTSSGSVRRASNSSGNRTVTRRRRMSRSSYGSRKSSNGNRRIYRTAVAAPPEENLLGIASNYGPPTAGSAANLLGGLNLGGLRVENALNTNVIRRSPQPLMNNVMAAPAGSARGSPAGSARGSPAGSARGSPAGETDDILNLLQNVGLNGETTD